MIGNEKDYLATRVAYKLNLRGPALNIYTACSTSLVTVCQAVAGLQSFQCDVALAGGVSVKFPQERGYLHQEGSIYSPDGHCRAFDENAQGTVFSNGLGSCRAEAFGRCRPRWTNLRAAIQIRRSQQRRRGQGELHGAERQWTRRSHRSGPCIGERGAADDRLY